jgi:hypothetical protein
VRRLLWAVSAAIFFLNPGFACGPAEPQYQYGAAEMRAAVEGNWSFTIMPDGASSPIQVTVKVEQAATTPGPQVNAPGRRFIRAAYACGSRTLVKSAAACIDSSVMPLVVTFVSGDASFANAQLSGTFTIDGIQFVTAISDLELVLGGYHISSQLSPEGSLVMPRIGPGELLGTLTMATRS